MLAGLHFWASHTGNVVPTALQIGQGGLISAPDLDFHAALSPEYFNRRSLIEVMDRIVVHEKYYHSVYGRFTKALSRIDFTLPKTVANQYEVRVVEADENRLLITAVALDSADDTGKSADNVADRASIDQFFRVESNFAVPAPRPEYLKIHAFKQLRLALESAEGQVAGEEGVYKDYFRYEVRRDSRDQIVAFAIGVKPPVLGLQLQADKHDQLMAEDSQANLRRLTGLMIETAETQKRAAMDIDDGGGKFPSAGQNSGQTSDGGAIAGLSDLWNISHFPIDDHEAEPNRRTAGEANALVVEPIEDDVSRQDVQPLQVKRPSRKLR